jgi:hypothetical protein
MFIAHQCASTRWLKLWLLDGVFLCKSQSSFPGQIFVQSPSQSTSLQRMSQRYLRAQHSLLIIDSQLHSAVCHPSLNVGGEVLLWYFRDVEKSGEKFPSRISRVNCRGRLTWKLCLSPSSMPCIIRSFLCVRFSMSGYFVISDFF